MKDLVPQTPLQDPFYKKPARPVAKPFFTIAVTCKNYEQFVTQCLESVFLQSFTNWELGIIDDCSDDRSFEMIYRTIRRFSHIINPGRIFMIKRNDESKGTCACRNEIFKAASGKYLLYLDADDYLLHTALANLNQFIKDQEEPHIVHFYEYWLDWKVDTIINLDEFSPIRELKDFQPILGNFVYSREAFNLVGGFDALNFGDFWEDFDLYIRIIRWAQGCVAFEKPLLMYRFNKLESREKSAADSMAWKDKVLKIFERHPEFRELGWKCYGRHLFPADMVSEEAFNAVPVSKNPFKVAPRK